MAVFGSSAILPGSAEWLDAETVGATCASAGLAVVTGGYGGVMEAASKGAAALGGRVIGVTAPALFPDREGANPFVTEEVAVDSLIERIGVLTELASGAVVMPGSIGTATELLVAWNLNYIRRGTDSGRLPTVAVGKGWQALWSLLSQGLDAAGDHVHVAETGSEAMDWLLTQPEIRCIHD